MANQEHLHLLRQGVEAWNRWREENPSVKPDLSQLDFESIREICVVGPNLSWYNLSSADLRMSSIRNAAVANASFENAYMVSADLCFGYFGHCNFRGAKLRLSRLGSAELTYCDFTGADLAYCTAEETKFTGSVLSMVNMQQMQLVATDFSEASLQGALVYGISAWDLKLKGATQTDLIITPPEGALITVDDLDLAQFVYLLLRNNKLRNVIDTITSKVVLILGRFTPERKPILDALRAHLRGHDLVPILFDFERPTSRSFIETASTIAHMARFIVADFTDQGDVRREVQHIAGTLQSVPIVPMLHSGESALPITLQDLADHPCMLPVVRYASIDELLSRLKSTVIEPALALERKLRRPRIELKESG
jgi:uncharacterized protein YjbI with pentapeptide repeats